MTRTELLQPSQTPVRSLSEEEVLLDPRNVRVESRIPEKVADRIHVLFEVAEELGFDVFVIDLGRTEWVCLMEQGVEMNEDIKAVVKSFQQMLEKYGPEDDLAGKCQELVDEAYEMRLIHDALRADAMNNPKEMKEKKDEAMYPVGNFHYLGIEYVGSQIVVIDFTVRDTVFFEPNNSREYIRPGQRKIFGGMIFVCQRNNRQSRMQELLERLYQSKWKVDDVLPQRIKPKRE